MDKGYLFLSSVNGRHCIGPLSLLGVRRWLWAPKTYPPPPRAKVSLTASHHTYHHKQPRPEVIYWELVPAIFFFNLQNYIICNIYILRYKYPLCNLSGVKKVFSSKTKLFVILQYGQTITFWINSQNF